MDCVSPVDVSFVVSMTVRPIPAGVCSNPRTLEPTSKTEYVDYVACEHCHHIWSASKATGEFVKNPTPLPPLKDKRPPTI